MVWPAFQKYTPALVCGKLECAVSSDNRRIGSRKEKGLEKKQGLTELEVDIIVYLYAGEGECLIKVD